jgi:DNA primase
MDLDWYDWHWTPENGYKDRVIVPFFHENVVVGWTGRKITEGKPKYLTTSQSGVVFNIDRQTDDRKFVIVVEGQFDAIAVDGVAIMHNEPNDTQIARINKLGKEAIVVPDNDKPGATMIKKALEAGWSVSLPDWGPDVKDVADAVKKFGRIYTLFTILQYREQGEIKIQLIKKKLEQKNDQ